MKHWLRAAWCACALVVGCGDGDAPSSSSGAGGASQAAGTAGAAQAGKAGGLPAGGGGAAQAGGAGAAQAGGAGAAQAGAAQAGAAQAGAGGGGSGGAGGGGGATKQSTGLIVVASIPPSSAPPDGRGLVTASFLEDHTDPCKREVSGACTLSRCPAASAPGAAPPDAGTITVETSELVASLSPDSGAEPGTYAPFTASKSLYFNEDVIRIEAAGGDVPGFEEYLLTPRSVMFNKPYTKPGETLTLDSAKDYLCEWETAGDEIRFSVSMKDSSSGSAEDVDLSCTFDGVDGKGAVPQALLAKLPKKQGSLSLSARNQVVVMAGKYAVTLRALAPAYGPTGLSITTEVVVK